MINLYLVNYIAAEQIDRLLDDCYKPGRMNGHRIKGDRNKLLLTVGHHRGDLQTSLRLEGHHESVTDYMLAVECSRRFNTGVVFRDSYIFENNSIIWVQIFTADNTPSGKIASDEVRMLRLHTRPLGRGKFEHEISRELKMKGEIKFRKEFKKLPQKEQTPGRFTRMKKAWEKEREKAFQNFLDTARKTEGEIICSRDFHDEDPGLEYLYRYTAQDGTEYNFDSAGSIHWPGNEQWNAYLMARRPGAKVTIWHDLKRPGRHVIKLHESGILRKSKIKSKEYTLEVPSTFIETLKLEGTIKTADQLFTNGKESVDTLIYHIFTFEYNDGNYEFKVKDDDLTRKYLKKKKYSVYINPKDLARCWFEDEERNVLLCEPDEEE